MTLVFINPKHRPGQYLFDVSTKSATWVVGHNIGIAGNLDYEAREIQDTLPRFAGLRKTTSIVLSGGGKFQIGPCRLQRGEYYPRIFRPLYFSESRKKYPPVDSYEYGSAATQLTLLCSMLGQIFRTVLPRNINLRAYGHEIRNVLVLASTEFEAQCKGILRANGYSPGKTNLDTRDYVKLRDPLHLAAYSIELPPYPWLGPIRPFKSWHASQPSKSLAWYKAYNDTKHDREVHFERATLKNAILAVCGCITVFEAQFGGVQSGDKLDLVAGLARIASGATWLPSDGYFPELSSSPTWRRVEYVF